MSGSDYIKIASISDLDVTKVSIPEMNKKYIDSEGNRFQVRFNPDTKKKEIVKLILTKNPDGKIVEKLVSTSLKKVDRVELKKLKGKTKTVDEIMDEMGPSITHKTMYSSISEKNEDVQGQSQETEEKSPNLDEGLDLSDFNPNERIETSSTFGMTMDESLSLAKFDLGFFEERIRELDREKERVKGILSNLKNSKVFDSLEDTKIIMSDFFREFEIEVFQGIDKVVNFYKELTSYPRPISYYSSRYDKKRKEVLNKIDEDKEQLKYIIEWEMLDLMIPLYEKQDQMLKKIETMMASKKPEQLIKYNFREQQMFEDARNALGYCLREVENVQMMLIAWKGRQ